MAMATAVGIPLALSSPAVATTLDLQTTVVSIGGDHGNGTGQVNFYSRESGNATVIFSSHSGRKAYVSGKVVKNLQGPGRAGPVRTMEREEPLTGTPPSAHRGPLTRRQARNSLTAMAI